MKRLLLFSLLLLASLKLAQALPAAEPLRLCMVGLVHGHAGGFLNRYLGRQDIRLVGIAEPDQDFLSYLIAVVRKEVKPSGLSSLENNLIVTEILDAARTSASTGKRVVLK